MLNHSRAVVGARTEPGRGGVGRTSSFLLSPSGAARSIHSALLFAASSRCTAAGPPSATRPPSLRPQVQNQLHARSMTIPAGNAHLAISPSTLSASPTPQSTTHGSPYSPPPPLPSAPSLHPSSTYPGSTSPPPPPHYTPHTPPPLNRSPPRPLAAQSASSARSCESNRPEYSSATRALPASPRDRPRQLQRDRLR